VEEFNIKYLKNVGKLKLNHVKMSENLST